MSQSKEIPNGQMIEEDLQYINGVIFQINKYHEDIKDYPNQGDLYKMWQHSYGLYQFLMPVSGDKTPWWKELYWTIRIKFGIFIDKEEYPSHRKINIFWR